METIADIGTVSGEIVVTERKITSEFAIIEINEHIQMRTVRVTVELGPFTEAHDGIPRRGASMRMITVWQGDAYDAVRDTWTNADLISLVQSILTT